MTPEPLPRAHVAWLSFVAVFYALGCACIFASVRWHSVSLLAPTLFIVPATVGVMYVYRGLRYHHAAKHFVKDNQNLPMQLTMVDEHNAMVTTLGGQLVSLHIPDEVVQAGPQAVMSYVVSELED